MDLRDLGKIYTADGPFVTIYLATDRTEPNAAQRYDTRWKNLLRELEEQDIDESTRTALDRTRGQHDGGGTRVLVASHGQVHLATYLPEPPPTEIIQVSPLPHLLPLIESLQLRMPHVIVLADRIGADILAYTSGPDPDAESTVEGTRLHTRKVHSGGWNMRHMQARAEEGWEHNAKEVAHEIERVVRDVDPQVIILTGDVRAVTLLRGSLPERERELVREVEGSRGTDGGSEHIADRVLEVLTAEQARRTLESIDTFTQERSRADRAADGLAETVAALRGAQVETLLLTDTFDGDRELWFGAEPNLLATSRDDVAGLDRASGREPQRAAAADVLVRAVVGTDAALRLVPGDVAESPREGVGAVLRFASAGG